MAEKRGNEFTKSNIFSYNRFKKRFFIFSSIGFIILFLALIILYFTSLRNSNFYLIERLNAFFVYIATNVKSGSLLGAFYTTLFGGLFFIPIPMDVLFINFLRSGHIFAFVILVYIAGLICSFSINYWVGGKLTYLSKRLIGIKKFYKVKSRVNKYGSWGIFIFNLLPLPGQILAVIAGVFKYNKAKFYISFIAGQTIKFTIIAIGYFYIV